LNSVQIRATDPANTFNVGVNGGCTFDSSKDAAIWLDLTNTTNAPNYSVGIENNAFHALTQISGGNTHLGAFPDQIIAQNFDLVQSNADNSELNISKNSMTTDDGQTSESVPAAIDLQISNAELEGNTITSAKYNRGIIDLGANSGNNPLDYAYICSNHIANLGTSIYTSYCTGHMVLNELDHSYYGYRCMDGGTMSLIENNIHDCSYGGIDIEYQPTLDMSGTHSGSTDVGAYNQVVNNYNSSGGDDISDVTNTGLGGGLIIGKNGNDWSDYADNIITTDGSNAGDDLICCGEGMGYPDMTNNYWGYGYIGGKHFIDPTNSLDWADYFYTNSLTASKGLPDPGPKPPQMECGNPDATQSSKGSHQPLSTSSSDTASDSLCFAKIQVCIEWVDDLQTNFDVAYDTLRKYLTHCPDAPNALHGLSTLEALDGVATQTKSEAGRLDLRNWLMAERHASSWEGWYCTCVAGIGGTFDDTRASLALLKFLMNDSKCIAFDTPYWHSYQTLRGYQFSIWRDTAKNDSIQYFDTTLPNFDMLGLDSLLADEASQGVQPNAPQVITFISASPNPVSAGTIISFGLMQEAYVKIELFDVLGKLQASAVFEG
ncbi:MAG: hypothetical protein ACREBW_02545, partial [Candidatus Micrarchaeaceae archaeon]